jgi:SAM-dependent methyltransferase
MSDTQSFDSLAATYDDDFTESEIARWLRARVHERLTLHFGAGDQVLELGCGTGEDALYLARRGVQVLATDASLAMLDVARAKTAAESNVTVAQLNLREIPPHPQPLYRQNRGTPSHQGRGEQTDAADMIYHAPTGEFLAEDTCETAFSPLSVYGEGVRGRGRFSGVFSNFGGLNCLDDWRPLAAWLAERIQPGGIAAFGIMSPFCLWEIGWHSIHGDFNTATRRLRPGATFQPAPDIDPISIHYPTIRRFKHDFAPYFECIHASGLGLFLPPSDVYGMVERRPRLLATLTALERHFGRYAPLLADHYWIEFRRRDEDES